MTKNKTSAVVVRLDDELRAALQSHADEHERTAAQTVRLAIRQFLDRENRA